MTTKIILYHKRSCPYCVEFMPTWRSLNQLVKEKYGNRYATADIEVTSFDPSMYDKTEIAQIEKIRTVPTLFVKKDGNFYQFKGDRTVDAIMQFSETCDQALQTGGADERIYKPKYLKYKKKYLELKSRFH